MTAMETNVPSSGVALERFSSWKKSQTSLKWTIFPHQVVSQNPASIDAKISFVDESRERVRISSCSDPELIRWIELRGCTELLVRKDSVEVVTASGTGYLIEVT